MSNRDDEEAVAAVGNTSKGVVPSGECSQETEETTCLNDGSVGLASRVPLQVTNTKQQEGQVQEQEEAEEGDSGSQSAEQQDGGKDEPALRRIVNATLILPAIDQAYQQVQSHRVVKHGGATGGFNRRLDLEPTGGQDNGERDPETSVGGQSSGTEGVSDSHFPINNDQQFISRVWQQGVPTTCQQATERDHHIRKPDQRRCCSQRYHGFPC